MKQIKDKGAVFPFLESENGRKPLPWKKILTYEVSRSQVVKLNGLLSPPHPPTFLSSSSQGFSVTALTIPELCRLEDMVVGHS